MEQAQKKSGSLRFWVGRSYFLGRFWGKNGLILGCFRSAALPLRLCGSVWAVLGDALRALYLPSAPPLVVQGVGVPRQQKPLRTAQNERRRSKEKAAPGTEYERRQIIKPSTVRPSTALFYFVFLHNSERMTSGKTKTQTSTIFIHPLYIFISANAFNSAVMVSGVFAYFSSHTGK